MQSTELDDIFNIKIIIQCLTSYNWNLREINTSEQQAYVEIHH